MAVFGAVLRWTQGQIALNREAGAAAVGAPIPWAMAGISLLFLAGLVVIVLRFRSRCAVEKPTQKRGSSVMWLAAACLAALLTAISAVIMFVSASDSRYCVLIRILSALELLAGISMPFVILGCGTKKAGTLSCVCAVAMIVFYAYWLIVCYKVNSTQPEIWIYAMEILASSMSMLAVYYLSGAFFARPMPFRAMFFCDTAAFFCITALPGGNTAQKLLLIATAAVLLMSSFLQTERT